MSTKQKLLQHVSAHLDPEKSLRLFKKVSTTSRLAGIELDQTLEHQIIDGKASEIVIDFLPLPESTHETSGTELSDF